MNKLLEDKIKNLVNIFKLYSQLKLVYFFGSKTTGKEGPLSDYDFAIYLDERDKNKRFDLRISILAKLSVKLKTDEVDVIVLNDTQSPELKFNIVKEGKLIYEEEPYKMLVEPRILNEYFDFISGLRKYGLTKT